MWVWWRIGIYSDEFVIPLARLALFTLVPFFGLAVREAFSRLFRLGQ